MRPARRADNCAVLGVANVKVRTEAQRFIPPPPPLWVFVTCYRKRSTFTLPQCKKNICFGVTFTWKWRKLFSSKGWYISTKLNGIAFSKSLHPAITFCDLKCICLRESEVKEKVINTLYIHALPKNVKPNIYIYIYIYVFNIICMYIIYIIFVYNIIYLYV